MPPGPGKTEWQKALSWLDEDSNTANETNAAALQKYFTERPDQVTVKDEYGRMPLHRAAGCQIGEHAVAIVTFLLNAHRDGARHKSMTGYLPLHFAARFQRGEPGATIATLLLTAYPAGAMQKDNKGRLPADRAENHTNLPSSCIAMLRAAAKGKWTPPKAAVAHGNE